MRSKFKLFHKKTIIAEEQTIKIQGLPETFESFRICQLTDIHHGRFVNIEYIDGLVEMVNGLKPDIIVLTGDYVDNSQYPLTSYFISNSLPYIDPCIGALGRLTANFGVFAVLGNHDNLRYLEKIRMSFLNYNITLIENTRQLIEKEGKTICIAGVGDLWGGVQDLKSALKDIPSDIPRILLSHNPEYAEKMPKNERVDLVISGHTHGGQIRIPFSFAPFLFSKYGQRYSGGLVELEHTQVYVSRGIGVIPPPIRFNCPPEVPLLTLRRA